MINLKSLVESKLFPVKESIPAQLGDELINVMKQMKSNRNDSSLDNLMSKWFIGPNSTAEKVDLNKLKGNLVGKNADPNNYYILTKDGKPLVTVKNGQVYQSWGYDERYKDYGKYSLTALSKIADGAWRITPDKEVAQLRNSREKMKAAMSVLAGKARPNKDPFQYDARKGSSYDLYTKVYWNGDHWEDVYGRYTPTQIAEFAKEGLFHKGWGNEFKPASEAEIEEYQSLDKGDITYDNELVVKVPASVAKRSPDQVQPYPNAETRKELNAKLREMMLAYRDQKVEELRTEYNNLYPELADAAVTGDDKKERLVQNKLNSLRNALSYLKRLAEKLPGEQKKWSFGDETYNLEYKNAKEMMNMFSDIRRDIDRQINNIKTGESW